MKSLVPLSFSLAFLTLTSIADEITLTPKDGQGEPVVINTSEKSEVTLGGKTYLVQPKAEPATMTKAKAIRIPHFDLSEIPLEMAIEFLTQKSIELDNSEKEEERGLNFVVTATEVADLPRLTLMLRNVSIFDALGFISEATGTKVEFRESAIVFSKKEGQ